MRSSLVAVLIVTLGILFFLYGFFLTRRELPAKAVENVRQLSSVLKHVTQNSHTLMSLSQATAVGSSEDTRSSPSNSSKSAPRKVFLFIVDALRLDFMVEHPKQVPNNSPYNKLESMHRLLRENATQSMLFGFRADPPTVTSQRLKSIVTGTLPTFIDIGANLNSSAVTDDNIIDQLLRRGRPEGATLLDNQCEVGASPRIVVLGDDTWGALYPHQLTVTHLYDSFNTRDLDTVDDGIAEHLPRYLSIHADPSHRANDNGSGSTNISSSGSISGGSSCPANSNQQWDMLVAHFLGVDHIGHTHHAFHPLMSERLTRIDTLLLQAVEALPPDGILLMFGDHGMTDQGEHGGSSGNETDSGLFVYSKQPLFAVQPPSTLGEEEPTTLYWSEHSASLQRTPLSKIRQHPRMVSQLDLTPTLALLLGVPIPASSLGMVIPELFLVPDLQRSSSGSDNSAQGRFVTAGMDGLSDTFYINAMQVWRYLKAYWGPNTNPNPLPSSVSAGTAGPAGTSSRGKRRRTQQHAAAAAADSLVAGQGFTLVPDPLTHPELAHLEELLLSAVTLHYHYLAARQGGGPISSSDTKNTTTATTSPPTLAAVHRAYYDFFQSMQDMTREKWTQFKMLPIMVGLLVMTAGMLLLLHNACTAVRQCLCPSIGAEIVAGATNVDKAAQGGGPVDWLFGLWELLAVRPILLPGLAVGAGFLSMAAYSDNFTIYEPVTVFCLMQAFNAMLVIQAWWYGDGGGSRAALRRQVMAKAVALMVAVGLLGHMGNLNWQQESPSWLWRRVRLLLVPALALAVHKVYRRLLANSSTFRAATGAAREGPLHGVCVALHGLGSAYLLVYWAARHLPERTLLRLKVALAVLGLHTGPLRFLVEAAALVDWLLLLPAIVLALHLTVVSMSVCALLEARWRGLNRQPSVLLALLLHVYFGAVNVIALFLGPAYGCLLYGWVVVTILYVQSYQQMLYVCRTTISETAVSAAGGDPRDRDSGNKVGGWSEKRTLLLWALALYFPVAGRLLFFCTGHRMDFGTLQLSAAFVGRHSFDFVYAGAALAVNTFGAYLLAGLSLYVSMLYIELKEAIRAKERAHKMRLQEGLKINNSAVDGKRVTWEDDRNSPPVGNCSAGGQLLSAVAAVALVYHALVVVHSCWAAAILRRHLMVWRVFAPKMAFEACIWIVYALAAVLVDVLVKQ